MTSSFAIHTDTNQHTNERGNYRDYYRRRSDHLNRVSLLCDHWFRRKVCLDVGCNKGLLCVELAARFEPTSILGIDSDPLLIDKIMMWTTMLSYRSLRLSESLSKTNKPRPRPRTSNMFSHYEMVQKTKKLNDS